MSKFVSTVLLLDLRFAHILMYNIVEAFSKILFVDVVSTNVVSPEQLYFPQWNKPNNSAGIFTQGNGDGTSEDYDVHVLALKLGYLLNKSVMKHC